MIESETLFVNDQRRKNGPRVARLVLPDSINDDVDEQEPDSLEELCTKENFPLEFDNEDSVYASVTHFSNINGGTMKHKKQRSQIVHKFACDFPGCGSEVEIHFDGKKKVADIQNYWS